MLGRLSDDFAIVKIFKIFKVDNLLDPLKKIWSEKAIDVKISAKATESFQERVAIRINHRSTNSEQSYYSPDHLAISDQSIAIEQANELVEWARVEEAVLERIFG